MQKKKHHRTDDDITQLMESFNKLKFFRDLKNLQKLSEHEERELMQCLSFEKYKKDEKVFEYGDSGQKFYIMFKGVCSVYIRNDQISDWYS